jgi:hypothetical protein
VFFDFSHATAITPSQCQIILRDTSQPYRRITMTMLTNLDRIHRRDTVRANPEIEFESLVPVILMSSVGLTLSLLIAALTAS